MVPTARGCGSISTSIPQEDLAWQNRRHSSIGPDRSANLARAIDCYKAALRVYTEADFPEGWAATHNNLGVAYRLSGQTAKYVT